MSHDFGPVKTRSIYENYIGKWVLIYPHGNHTTFSGKMNEIMDGYAILNPFQAGEVREGKLVRALISDDFGAAIFLDGSTIEPVTEEYIRKYCENADKRDEERSSQNQVTNQNS